MILVTGGTGLVGTNLIGALLGASRKVRCVVRHPERAPGLSAQGVELAGGDVTDAATLDDAFGGGVDAVYHLVGILVEPRGTTYRKVHVEGTRNVVDACRRRGVGRYIHVSALGTRPDARSEYHRTKWEAEEIVRSSGLEYTIFRPSVIFGKGDRFTNVFARAIRLSPVVFVPGTGANLMQPVFVGDLAAAMVMALGMEGAANRVFEAAGPVAMTFDAVIDAIAQAIGKRRLKVHVPMPLMRVNAALAEALLAHPPISRDALLMLEEDNVTADNALVSFFGMKPTGFMDGMRTYLH